MTGRSLTGSINVIVVSQAILHLIGYWHLEEVRLGREGLYGFTIHAGDKTTLLYAPLAVFVHASREHLLINAANLFLMLPLAWWMVGPRVLAVLLAGAVVGAWIIIDLGYPGSFHGGASSLVYALIGFFYSYALFNRRFFVFLVAIFMAFLNWGSLGSVLPGTVDSGFSWQGHFGGLLAGMLVGAWFLFNGIETEPRKRVAAISRRRPRS